MSQQFTKTERIDQARQEKQDRRAKEQKQAMFKK